jgi:hypothetical protein
MCNSCFNSESLSFKSPEEYNAFDLVITNKVIFDKTLVFVKFIKTGEVQIDFRDYEELGYNVYQCLKCQALWGFRTEFGINQISFFAVTESTILKDAYKTKFKLNRNLIILVIFAVATTLILMWANNYP